jgi:hypothetical protein
MVIKMFPMAGDEARVRRALGLTREPPHISRSRWGYER